MNTEIRPTQEEMIQAIKDSIQHWQENLELVWRGELPDTRAEACALCRLYALRQMGSTIIDARSCRGCPIFVSSGLTACKSTPYYDIRDYLNRIDTQRQQGAPEKLEDKLRLLFACNRMVEYLKNILTNISETKYPKNTMKTVYALTQRGRGSGGHGEPGKEHVELGHDGEWYDLGKLYPIFENKDDAEKFLANEKRGQYYEVTPMTFVSSNN